MHIHTFAPAVLNTSKMTFYMYRVDKQKESVRAKSIIFNLYALFFSCFFFHYVLKLLVKYIRIHPNFLYLIFNFTKSNPVTSSHDV